MDPPAEICYGAAPATVRDDLVAAHRRAWHRLAAPGTWWDGRERVAIAAETRHATGCAACAKAKAALTPNALTGAHDSLGRLPDPVVAVIHRIRNDAARLTKSWLDRALAGGISDGQYVELVGVIATIVAVDRFTDALGMARHALPAPRPGAPSRYRPAGAKLDEAWLPMVAPEDVGEPERALYDGLSGAYIHRALSLVPDEVLCFFDLDSVQYLPDRKLRDFGREYRAISHAQIELLAGRVSAINRCVY